MEDKFIDNSRRKLVEVMKKEVTKMMEQSLDFAQVACPKDNFIHLRSKILRAGNNCMRVLEKESNDYEIKYLKINEELIEFNIK